MIVFVYGPNRNTQVLTPTDTAWHDVTIPTSIPRNPTVAVNCVASVLNAAGTGAGSLYFLDFEAAATPPDGFPIPGGTLFPFSGANRLAYRLTTSTDVLYLIWSW